MKYVALFFLNHIVNKIPSYNLRNFIYKYIFRVKLGKSTSILMNVKFLLPCNITIGDNSIINYQCCIDGRGGSVIIGNNVDIAPEVNIWTLSHDPDSPNHDVKPGNVVVENYAWLANRVIVLPGVTIGEGSVVAAGSIVTKDTKPYSLYAGTPARYIRDLKTNKKEYKLKHRPFLYY